MQYLAEAAAGVWATAPDIDDKGPFPFLQLMRWPGGSDGPDGEYILNLDISSSLGGVYADDAPVDAKGMPIDDYEAEIEDTVKVSGGNVIFDVTHAGPDPLEPGVLQAGAKLLEAAGTSWTPPTIESDASRRTINMRVGRDQVGVEIDGSVMNHPLTHFVAAIGRLARVEALRRADRE